MIARPAGGLSEPPAQEHAEPWGRVGRRLLLLVAALCFLFRETLGSMVGIWWRSETFTHGFLVAPASLLVTWKLRRRLASVAPRSEPRALVAVGLAAIAWLVARVAGIQGAEQLSFVGLLVAVVVATIGLPASRSLLFPLSFLFLMVPLGEVLIPGLIEITTRMAVGGLHVVGIPVVRDGDLLWVPNGHWRVVEACSGLRYLIASFTLGWLFAWWTFSTLRRRLVFVLLSILVPILANGLRAFLIIFLGYVSDMKIATGVDHYLYGWIFFTLVMGLLFWAGRIWADRVSDPGPFVMDEPRPASTAAARRPFPVAAVTLVVAVAAVWYAGSLETRRAVGEVALPTPAPAGGWIPLESGGTPWEPDFHGTDAAFQGTYATGDTLVWLYVGYFADQRQDHELINTQNVLVATTNPTWRLGASFPAPGAIEATGVDATESVVKSEAMNLLAWSWYWVAGEATGDPTRAKWLGAQARLLRRSDAAALVVVFAPEGSDRDDARRRIRAFVRTMLPSIQTTLREADRATARDGVRP
jgi:exosortase A